MGYSEFVGRHPVLLPCANAVTERLTLTAIVTGGVMLVRGAVWPGRHRPALEGSVRQVKLSALRTFVPRPIYQPHLTSPHLTLLYLQPHPKHRTPQPSPQHAAAMRPTSRLLDAVRITLFTRPGCGLCDTAKDVLSGLRARRPFAYREVDIAKEEAKGWRDLYDFDVPVVSPVSLLGPVGDDWGWRRGVRACAYTRRFTLARAPRRRRSLASRRVRRSSCTGSQTPRLRPR